MHVNMSLRNEGVLGKDMVLHKLPYSCADFGRNRKRTTDVDFEKCLDHFTHMLSTWNKDVLHTVLQSLVRRCPLNQIEFLYTSLEAINHRDFLFSSVPPPGCPGNVVRPLSTTFSRQTRSYLSRTRKKVMNRIHRTDSIILQTEVCVCVGGWADVCVWVHAHVQACMYIHHPPHITTCGSPHAGRSTTTGLNNALC
jgi:hypothetical protein